MITYKENILLKIFEAKKKCFIVKKNLSFEKIIVLH